MGDQCRICNSTDVAALVRIREMMFGLREFFDYRECRNCGCLQIAEYPRDIARFYPKDYYSFNASLPEARVSATDRVFLLLKYFARMAYNKISKSYQPPWPVRLNIPPHHAVLDIGCGNGARVLEWFNLGMTHITGIDEFIDNDRVITPDVRIRKGNFYRLTDKYDVVMMHETLEHLPDQLKVFLKVNELLRDKGMFFIRIPLKSWAWEHYGADWVQLDAPRHYYIHTESSLKFLAEKAGFRIENVIYDSWAFQFVGSELYKRNISLTEAKNKSLFSEEEMEQFRLRARRLNEEKRGDQAAFVLRKVAGV